MAAQGFAKSVNACSHVPTQLQRLDETGSSGPKNAGSMSFIHKQKCSEAPGQRGQSLQWCLVATHGIQRLYCNPDQGGRARCAVGTCHCSEPRELLFKLSKIVV